MKSNACKYRARSASGVALPMVICDTAGASFDAVNIYRGICGRPTLGDGVGAWVHPHALVLLNLGQLNRRHLFVDRQDNFPLLVFLFNRLIKFDFVALHKPVICVQRNPDVFAINQQDGAANFAGANRACCAASAAATLRPPGANCAALTALIIWVMALTVALPGPLSMNSRLPAKPLPP